MFCLLYFNGSTQELLKIKIAKPGKSKEKCTATLLGRAGGNITKAELASCNSIEVKGPCDYKVVSFVFSFVIHDNLRFIPSDSVMNSVAQVIVRGMPVNSKFYIEDIKVKSNVTGQIFTMPSLKFKVVP